MFDVYDADKSGTLAQGEVSAILSHIQSVVTNIHGDGTSLLLLSPNLFPSFFLLLLIMIFITANLAKLLTDEIKVGLDANKDGKISKDEFVAFALKKPSLVKALTIQV